MPMELEAAADLVTGAVIGRAVEPDIGEGRAIGAGACLNCGVELLGGHCHGCGQPAHVHRTLGAIGHDIAHGVFHFEGKIWRTLPMLAVKPGQLTRRYIHGERAKFVSPLALFLFSVFLMFAVFESVGGPINAGKSDAEREASYREELSTQRATIAALEKERETMRARGANTAKIDADLKDRRDTLKGVTVGWDIANDKPTDLSGAVNVDTGLPGLDARVREAAKNPKLLLYKLQSSAYKFAWAVIPLSLPFMWLMFAWRRQYKIYDHAIFVTYSLCFMMLLSVTIALLGAVGIDAAVLLLAVPVHFFFQLKGAYALRNRSAAWRTAALIAVATFVMIAFGALLLALGLLG